MKKFLLYLLVAALFGALLYWILSQKPIGRTTVAKPVATLTVEELYRQFYEDENLANEKYLNKSIRISGPLRDVVRNPAGYTTVVLESGRATAHARLNKEAGLAQLELNVGDDLTLVCTCAGLVEAVELRDCRVE